MKMFSTSGATLSVSVMFFFVMLPTMIIVFSTPQVTALSQYDHFSTTMSWLENAAARFQVPLKDRRRDSSVQCLPCDCSVSGTVNCYRQNITSLPLNLPPNITRLILDFTPITATSLANILMQYPALSNTLLKLNIGACEKLTYFPMDFFKKLPFLTYLNAVSTPITTLPDGLLDPVINAPLQLFSVCGKLSVTSTVTNRTFMGLTNLNVLCLSYNLITYIEAGAFSTLTRLTLLLIGVNLLTEIPSRLFADLPLLNILDFPINLINKPLPADVFSGSTSLFMINFYQNKISAILNGTFAGLRAITQLQCHTNKLTSLGKNLFAEMSLLVNLDFYDNQISAIEADTFRGLSSVQIVHLKGNIIASIHPAAFRFMSNLKLVDLSYNLLPTVPNVSLVTGINFTTDIPRQLLLHNNVIQEITSNVSSSAFPLVDFLTMSANPSQCFFFSLATVNNSSERQVKCNCSVGYFGGNANDLNSASFCERQDPKPLIIINRRTTSVLVLKLTNSTAGQTITPFAKEEIASLRFLSPAVVAVDSAFDLSYTRIDVQASLAVYCKTFYSLGELLSCYNNSNFFDGAAQALHAPMRYLDTIPPVTLNLRSCLYCSTLTPNGIDFHVNLNPNIPGYVVYRFDNISTIVAQQIGLGIYNPSLNSAYVNISAGQIPLSGNFNVSVMAFEELTGDSKTAAIITLNITDCAPLELQNLTGLNPCQHGGVCVDNTNPFDNKFSCDCSKTDYNGTFCETANPVVVTILQPAADSTSTYVGIGVGVSIPLILLILLGTYRVRQAMTARLNRKDFHIFISYRVKCDADIAEKLCLKLQEYFVTLKNMKNIHIRCFLDKQDIINGTEWKNAFIQALEHCCLFVPIVSEAGLNPMKFITPTDVKEDNVLLEYEIASKLSLEGRLNIFPILVGGGARGMLRSSSEATHKRITEATHTHERITEASTHERIVTEATDERTTTTVETISEYNFSNFGSHCFPQCFSLTSTSKTVSETLTYILGFQGVKLADAQKLTVHLNSSDSDGVVFPRRKSSTNSLLPPLPPLRTPRNDIPSTTSASLTAKTADSGDLAAIVIQVFTTFVIYITC